MEKKEVKVDYKNCFVKRLIMNLRNFELQLNYIINTINCISAKKYQLPKLRVAGSNPVFRSQDCRKNIASKK